MIEAKQETQGSKQTDDERSGQAIARKDASGSEAETGSALSLEVKLGGGEVKLEVKPIARFLHVICIRSR